MVSIMNTTTFRLTLLRTCACLCALAATGCGDFESPTSPTASPAVGLAPPSLVDRGSRAFSSTASEETAKVAGLIPGLPDIKIPNLSDLPGVPNVDVIGGIGLCGWCRFVVACLAQGRARCEDESRQRDYYGPDSPVEAHEATTRKSSLTACRDRSRRQR